MFSFLRKHKVKVIYKSGATQIIYCDKFGVTHAPGRITELSWENAKPTPLFIGVDEIAAVYEL